MNAVESVEAQTYKNTKHLVVVDGLEHLEYVNSLLNKRNCVITNTPNNTGGNGFYGHRIYAAYPHLIDSDYILFLDSDNWYDPDHVESLVDLMESKDLLWAHSLRKVYLNDKYLADDCCESTGRYPIHFTLDDPQPQHLVDTSSFAFKREFLIQVCQNWHSGWGGDRRFYDIITHKFGVQSFDTTGKHTLNYRLPDMNRAYGGDLDFFARGNELVKQRNGGKYPWISSS
jgi:glycosyltransferase involved in cell wall biosynthesis